MQVLSRHKNETIMIGDQINVTVLEIRGDKVRLAIEAPKDMPVHRHEVYEVIMREQGLQPRPQPVVPEPAPVRRALDWLVTWIETKRARHK